MIADNGRHYLYRHISLYGKVFYIGIGTKLNKPKGFNSHSTEYSRAYCKSKRNLEWYEESKNEYRIEILLESDSYNFIKEKEKEFIKLYKRIKDKGTLINKNAGGQGNLDFSITKKVYQYDLDGNFIKTWLSVDDIAKNLKINKNCIYRAIIKNKGVKDKRYFYEFKGDKIEAIKKHSQKQRIKVVLQFDENMNFIKRYEDGIYQVNKETGYSLGGIKKVLTNKSRTIYGYYFKYENSIPDKRSIPKDIIWLRRSRKKI